MSGKYDDQVSTLGKKFEKTEYWKPKEGLNRIRVIPAFNKDAPGTYVDYNKSDTSTWFFRRYKKVWKDSNAFIPRAQCGFEDCPYERKKNELLRLIGQGNEVAKKELESYKEQDTCAIWLIDRDDEAKGVQCWETTNNNLQQILNVCMDVEMGDVDRIVPDADGKGARDLKVTFTPKTKTANGFPHYAIAGSVNQCPLGTQEQIMEWAGKDRWASSNIPSDAEWISAVMTGTIAQYLASRKAQFKGEEPEAPVEDTPDAPGANFASGPTVIYPRGFSSSDLVWYCGTDKKVSQAKLEEISKLVISNKEVMILPLSKEGGWKTAQDFGIRVVNDADTPMPPSAPEPPTPPPSTPQHAVPQSEADALKAQIEALKAKQAASEEPCVADELESMLAGK